MTRHARQSAEARGRFAERLAELILTLKGYRILARRARTGSGELDLVCQKGPLIIIAEVKQRATLELGLNAVPERSWQRIGRAADLWLARFPDNIFHADRRYDLFIVRPGFRFCHIKDAWRPDSPLTHS